MGDGKGNMWNQSVGRVIWNRNNELCWFVPFITSRKSKCNAVRNIVHNTTKQSKMIQDIQNEERRKKKKEKRKKKKEGEKREERRKGEMRKKKRQKRT